METISVERSSETEVNVISALNRLGGKVPLFLTYDLPTVTISLSLFYFDLHDIEVHLYWGGTCGCKIVKPHFGIGQGIVW